MYCERWTENINIKKHKNKAEEAILAKTQHLDP